MITAPAHCIDYVNPKYEVATGYSNAEAFGKTPRVVSNREKSREDNDELWSNITSRIYLDS